MKRTACNHLGIRVNRARSNRGIRSFYQNYIWVLRIAEIFSVIIGIVLQRGATVERLLSNTRDTVWNLDVRQRGAAIKRRTANTRDAIRNCDARKVRAAVERIISNARDATDCW